MKHSCSQGRVQTAHSRAARYLATLGCAMACVRNLFKFRDLDFFKMPSSCDSILNNTLPSCCASPFTDVPVIASASAASAEGEEPEQGFLAVRRRDTVVCDCRWERDGSNELGHCSSPTLFDLQENT